ncbi:recombinase family protein, partial [Enterobacter hormaechei]
VFGIFAALAEFERELIAERTIAGLASGRGRGRPPGPPVHNNPPPPPQAPAANSQPHNKQREHLQLKCVNPHNHYKDFLKKRFIL